MRALVLLAAIGLSALLAGCSSGNSDRAAQTGATATTATTAAPPARSARERQMRAIVRAWNTRLNRGDNAGVAQLFALPAVIVQGPYAYRFKTRKQIALWHSGLPCSGKILSVTFQGRFATGVFRLANRGSHRCDAPGGLAAARFEIVGGKIVSWHQVDVPKQPTETGPIA